MAKITLHSDKQISVTSVSNIFIDEYMSDANGEFVKIYLYLLRLMNAPDAAFSISSIADKFEHTEKDIKRALCYWERMSLLRLEYDDKQNLTGVCLLDSVSKEDSTGVSIHPVDANTKSSSDAVTASTKASVGVTNPVAPATEPAAAATESDASGIAPDASGIAPDAAAAAATSVIAPATPPKKKSYSADDLSAFQQNEAVAELFFITERYLNRTLSATDINTILYIYDVLGFSTDLIEYLIEYCVSKGHTSIRYIEKVALAWAESNISTVADAKQSSSLHSQSYFMVMKALGIAGRNLVPAETSLIEKWTSEYGFTSELIEEACKRTIQTIHQPSFEYTDSILTNWHKKKIKNLTDVAKLDAEHQSRKKSTAASTSAASAPSKNKFNNFSQRSYDYDQLEKMLLTTSAN